MQSKEEIIATFPPNIELNYIKQFFAYFNKFEPKNTLHNHFLLTEIKRLHTNTI